MEQNDVIVFVDGFGHEVSYEILDIQLYNNKVYCVCCLNSAIDIKVYIFRVVEQSNVDYDRYIFETDQSIVDDIFLRFKERHIHDFQFSD